MSLIHWWPLNGTLEDLGIENAPLVNHGATVLNDGKIGKCYHFDGNNSYLITANSLDLNNYSLAGGQTISLWIRVDSFSNLSDDYTMILGLIDTDNDYSGIDLEYDGQWYMRVLTEWASVEEYEFSENQWVHLAFVCDETKGKNYLFINGNLIKEDEEEDSFSSVNVIGPLAIGGGYDVYEGEVINKFKGDVCDVRIYNHALSKKEVKELSKGLVLHYNFEDPYVEGTTNLVPNSNNFSGWSPYTNGYTSIQDCELGGKKVVITDCGTWCGISKSGITIPSTGTYTLSVWCKPISRTSTDVGQSLYFSGGGFSDITTWVPWDKPGQWTRVSRTITFTNTNPITLYLIAYGGTQGTDKISCEYTMPQIEKLDHATPYVNGTREQGTVSDNSGYGYNGTVTGSPQIVPNTGVGSYSCWFDGGSTAVQTPSLADLIHDGYFTLIGWFMHTSDWSSDGYETLYGGPSGFEIEAKHSNVNSPQFSPHNWGGSSSTDYRYVYTLNEWHQWAMVRTPSGTQFYFDGEFRFNGSTAGSIPSGNYFIGAWNTYGQQNYKGYIGDFKIYSTALSAEDIKAEYNRKASIDRNGNVFTNEIIEDNTVVSITKKNQVQTYSFKEGSDIAKFFGGYTQLEYIESTGTQYIDTGYANTSTPYQVDCDMEALQAVSNYWFGQNQGHGTMMYNGLYNNYSLEFDWKAISRDANNRCNMTQTLLSNGETVRIIINGVTYNVHKGINDSTGNFYIFACNGGGRKYGNLRLYSFRIHEGDTDIRKFIPAKRNKDSVIGLYDLVEHKFYTNQGTGTFVAGFEIGPLSAIALNEIKEI